MLMKGENHNFLGKVGFVYNIYIGDQDSKTIKRTWKELEGLSKKLRTQKKKVLILTDLTKIGRITLSARRKGLELVRSLDFDKVAMVGDDHLERHVVRIMVNLSGRAFQIKYFFDEKEARQWLLEK